MTPLAIRPASEPELNRLLASLLGEQQHLATPVVRASAAFDSHAAHSDHSALRTPHSAIHRDLIPLTAPGAGEQYAFEVDLDACSGCKSCVSACHSLNGLDEHESWRDVGLIVSEDESSPWQQTVTTACHHCAEPACLNGCPVAAYEKDPLTGIVRHLDDQCIGCSYCILKCPYDVPKFNARLGIVRKCDMCHQRLAVGEAPACGQACPTSAIRIVNVALSTARPPTPTLTPAPTRSPAPTPAPSSPDGGRRLSSSAAEEALVAAGPTTNGADGAAPSTNPSASASACGGSCGCKPPPTAPFESLRPVGRGLPPPSNAPSTGHRPQSTVHCPPSTAHRRRADTSHFLPAAPDPAYTQPTTRYVSARGIPARICAADANTLRVQPAHWPLAAMLTLTQLAVGLLATAPLIALPLAQHAATLRFGPFDYVNYWLTSAGSVPLPELVTYYVTNLGTHTAQFVGLSLLFAGLGASTLHLGRPLRAWRFFLGLRTSWLSREILVFSAFAPLALATLLWPSSPALRLALIFTGLIGIACSAMIYIDTRRRFWAGPPTCLRFFGTALVAALATMHPTAAAIALLTKLGCEVAQACGSSVPARLQRGPLRPPFAARLLLGITATASLALGPLWLALALFATGELVERLLFFRAVDAPKMPGHPAP